MRMMMSENKSDNWQSSYSQIYTMYTHWRLVIINHYLPGANVTILDRASDGVLQKKITF